MLRIWVSYLMRDAHMECYKKIDWITMSALITSTIALNPRRFWI